MNDVVYIGVNEFSRNTKHFKEPVANGKKIILTDHGDSVYMVVAVPEEYITTTTKIKRGDKDWSSAQSWKRELIRLNIGLKKLTYAAERAEEEERQRLEDKIEVLKQDIKHARCEILRLSLGGEGVDERRSL